MYGGVNPLPSTWNPPQPPPKTGDKHGGTGGGVVRCRWSDSGVVPRSHLGSPAFSHLEDLQCHLLTVACSKHKSEKELTIVTAGEVGLFAGYSAGRLVPFSFLMAPLRPFFVFHIFSSSPTTATMVNTEVGHEQADGKRNRPISTLRGSLFRATRMFLVSWLDHNNRLL